MEHRRLRPPAAAAGRRRRHHRRRRRVHRWLHLQGAAQGNPSGEETRAGAAVASWLGPRPSCALELCAAAYFWLLVFGCAWEWGMGRQAAHHTQNTPPHLRTGEPPIKRDRSARVHTPAAACGWRRGAPGGGPGRAARRDSVCGRHRRPHVHAAGRDRGAAGARGGRGARGGGGGQARLSARARAAGAAAAAAAAARSSRRRRQRLQARGQERAEQGPCAGYPWLWRTV